MHYEKQVRVENAQKRLEMSSKLTIQQKLEKARKKEKNGIPCMKEIVKYERMLEMEQSQNKRVPKQEQSQEQKIQNEQRQQKKVAHDQKRKQEIGN